jgi:hypothetical protein
MPIENHLNQSNQLKLGAYFDLSIQKHGIYFFAVTIQVALGNNRPSF